MRAPIHNTALTLLPPLPMPAADAEHARAGLGKGMFPAMPAMPGECKGYDDPDAWKALEHGTRVAASGSTPCVLGRHTPASSHRAHPGLKLTDCRLHLQE